MELGQSFARGQVDAEILPLVRVGRITALRQTVGRHSSYCRGRCFSAVAIAQQVSPAVERGTAPFQNALTTRAGADCPRHPDVDDVDQEATVLSMDGVGAFDLILRVAIGTAPVQNALTTRAGADCPRHPDVDDVDQEATVLSMDGVGAFDLILRVAIGRAPKH